jgi:hypothetical protein
LICIAAKLLEQSLPANSEILREKELEKRWYKLLESRGFSKMGFISEQKHQNGSSAGFISLYSINNIVEVSAITCLALQGDYPLKKKWFEILYDDFGKQIIIGIVIALVTFFLTYFFTKKG